MVTKFSHMPKSVFICTGSMAIIVALAVLAPWITPYSPFDQDILARMQGPSWQHWLGTDKLGRDLLSRIIVGLRESLMVSVMAVFMALLAGGTIGLTSAFYGGWLERIAMRMMDVLFAFPVMLLAIGIIAVLGSGALPTAIAIGIVYTPIFARLLRGPTLVISKSDYVLSARSVGASGTWIIIKHILPNLVSILLVQTSLLLSTAILVEASLSFLGLGTQPPFPSLGTMLAEGRNYMGLSPWSSVFPGIAILWMAFTFNLFGDILRDQLDPRLRGE